MELWSKNCKKKNAHTHSEPDIYSMRALITFLLQNIYKHITKMREEKNKNVVQTKQMDK